MAIRTTFIILITVVVMVMCFSLKDRWQGTAKSAPPKPLPIKVVSPNEAARTAGGWVAFPEQKEMRPKNYCWAVYLFPICQDGTPLRTSIDAANRQLEVFLHYYRPFEGAGDGWRCVRQRWNVGQQLCEARYYTRARQSSLDSLLAEVPSQLAVKPAK